MMSFIWPILKNEQASKMIIDKWKVYFFFEFLYFSEMLVPNIYKLWDFFECYGKFFWFLNITRDT